MKQKTLIHSFSHTAGNNPLQRGGRVAGRAHVATPPDPYHTHTKQPAGARAARFALDGSLFSYRLFLTGCFLGSHIHRMTKLSITGCP